jgi:hypothetical protein
MMYRIEITNDLGYVIHARTLDSVDPFVEKMLRLDPDALVIIAFGNGYRAITTWED